jgi:quercetin dioxygenase-like cupin family protein
MARAGASVENPVTGERIVFVQTAETTNGELLQLDVFLRPHGFVATEHIHPRQEERFTVMAGTATFSINGNRQTLASGTTITVPAGTPHLWWNGGDDQLHVRAEFRLALNTERFFETFFGLGRDGQTNAQGMPRFLQLAVLVPEYDLYLAQPPLVLQKLLFGALAPIGRLCGYKAWYPKYSTGQ